MLSGSLTRPAPELVQALVEHLACVLRRPDRVERCVLHFDIMALDLDQVGAWCRAGHGTCVAHLLQGVFGPHAHTSDALHLVHRLR